MVSINESWSDVSSRSHHTHAVCADVVLVNPPGVVEQHTHEIPTNPPVSTDASVLKEISIGNSK